MSFSKDIVDAVLVASGRCCCICHKFCGVKIETHHIQPPNKGGKDTYDNCIPLCFDCHADVAHYNDNHPKGRKYTVGELIKHRDAWYSKVKELNTPELPSGNVPHIKLAVSGNRNMIAGRDMNIHTERIVRKAVINNDPGGKHISNATARKIQELVKEYIDINAISGGDKRKAAQRIWSSMKNKFDVTSYKEILIEDSDNVIQWLYEQIARARPKIRRTNPVKWKESLYKPIYARANQLGISKEELYLLAQKRIPLKKQIYSLKELTQRDLQKLHRIIIYETKH